MIGGRHELEEPVRMAWDGVARKEGSLSRLAVCIGSIGGTAVPEAPGETCKSRYCHVFARYTCAYADVYLATEK